MNTTATAPVTSVSGATAPRRYFYRCADCLSVFTTAEPIPAGRDERGTQRLGRCGASGGWIEYMGRTERSRLVTESLRCPCDARCTHARGPSCDCKCGGLNHGSGLWVRVTIDQGGIPVAHVAPDALSKAAQYRALTDRVRAALDRRYGALIARKCAGDYLSGAEFSAYLRGCQLKRQLWAAQELRSHAGRNGRLSALLGEVN